VSVDGTEPAADTATGTGAGTDVTVDSAAATTGNVAADQDAQQAQQNATTALDEFDTALQQVSQDGDQAMQEQVASLQTQSQQVRQQLQEDPTTAGEDMQSLAQSAMTLQTASIPAEADAIMGRQIVTSDGEEGGEVSDVLVTADGQIEALLVKRGGALGLGGTQVAVTWDQLQLQGDQIVVNMTRDEMEQLPEYQTE
jgi:sporulation protein YlmC with PRC-barrel domain